MIDTHTNKQAQENHAIDLIVSYMNSKCGTKYKSDNAETRQLIRARLAEKYSIEDFQTVIDKKVLDWKNSEYAKYLRPQTLFGKNFDTYLNQPSTGNATSNDEVSQWVAASSEADAVGKTSRAEFAVFIRAVNAFFQKDTPFKNSYACEVWFRALKDIPFKTLNTALSIWVCNNKWSPTIADIRAESMKLSGNNTPDWGEAWNTVQKAIRKYGSYRGKEAIKALENTGNEVLVQTVKRLGFINLCTSENVVADRANFRNVYEMLQKSDKELKALTPNIRNAIEEISREQKLLEE